MPKTIVETIVGEEKLKLRLAREYQELIKREGPTDPVVVFVNICKRIGVPVENTMSETDENGIDMRADLGLGIFVYASVNYGFSLYRVVVGLLHEKAPSPVAVDLIQGDLPVAPEVVDEKLRRAVCWIAQRMKIFDDIPEAAQE